MRVGIVGAGPIALSMAAFLADHGDLPLLWSPSGRWVDVSHGEYTVSFTDKIEGQYTFALAADAKTLVDDVDVVIVAVVGSQHKAAFDAVLPFLRPEQSVIVSSHCSFGALYLQKGLAKRGLDIPVIAWSTTLTTCNPRGEAQFKVMTIRQRIDMATVPRRHAGYGLSLCKRLFGDRFFERDGLLAVAVSNVNPQNHLAICLCNFTRMENGETWNFNLNITESVSRLIDALDAERLSLARTLGVEVRTAREHWHFTHNVPVLPVHEATRVIEGRGISFWGQKTAQTNWVLEDVPFGLVPMVTLGRMFGCDMTLHEAGIAIYSALYGRMFRDENDLLPALDLPAIGAAGLLELCN
ncbi:hypothetical protein ACO34A_19510 [Rhizobium sp. ACO-34A]|nr:hypothetical protein ACO34A_19510 [Rhizobium sp. ACO-34A]